MFDRATDFRWAVTLCVDSPGTLSFCAVKSRQQCSKWRVGSHPGATPGFRLLSRPRFMILPDCITR